MRPAAWSWVLGGLPLLSHAVCPVWPVAPVDVVAHGYYADAQRSEVSPELLAQHRAATAPGRRFLAEVSRHADAFHARGDRAAADCALGGLQGWAQAGALLGRMRGPSQGQQAEYERKWLLAGLALAYLKLKPAASNAQRAGIEPWLGRVADAVWAFWEDERGRPSRHQRNNHYTWAGLALAATAAAQADDARWARARRVFDETLAQINAQGRLPLEMARGRRALHYHAYIAGPLVVMAALARSRGEDWLASAESRGRLQRLVDAVLQGMESPAAFAGQAQEQPTPATLAWLALWQSHDREPGRITRWLDAPPSVPTLGGDLMLMARRPW